ncbi:MAG TPA: hypothetical protein VLD63_15100 [Anaerolineales bacterium]|nr:hypothetical protein [Anaerolineales bacterium]
MDKFLRTTLMVLGILVLAALLFNFGVQLYWMLSGSAAGGYGMMGPMMGGRGWMHPYGGFGGMRSFGGFGFGFGLLGPILGIGLVVLLVAGIFALVRGGRNESGRTE